MRHLFSIAIALAALLSPVHAAEFREPAELIQLPDAAALPPLPDGWITVRAPFLRFHGPATDRAVLDRLAEHAATALPKLAHELGVPLGDTIHLYVADSEARFRELQPARAPMWADGVAYPRLNLVLLKAPSIRGGSAQPLQTVLRHELIHILLGQAFAPNTPPTWLQEGLAQVAAGELTPASKKTLAMGLATGSVMTLHGLSKGFPSDPVRARIAYAQSADFIEWLRHNYGEEAIPTLIRELSRGTEIEGAVHLATGELLSTVDQKWRMRLDQSGLKWSALANMDGLFGLAGILLIIGGIARRRQFHERLAQMEREEAALDALIGAYRQGSRRTG